MKEKKVRFQGLLRTEEIVKEVYEKKGWVVVKPAWPDFFAIKEVGGKKRIKFIEVKSLGDRLSQKQAETFELLQEVGFEVRLVRGLIPQPKEEEDFIDREFDSREKFVLRYERRKDMTKDIVATAMIVRDPGMIRYYEENKKRVKPFVYDPKEDLGGFSMWPSTPSPPSSPSSIEAKVEKQPEQGEKKEIDVEKTEKEKRFEEIDKRIAEKSKIQSCQEIGLELARAVENKVVNPEEMEKFKKEREKFEEENRLEREERARKNKEEEEKLKLKNEKKGRRGKKEDTQQILDKQPPEQQEEKKMTPEEEKEEEEKGKSWQQKQQEHWKKYGQSDGSDLFK